jgi:hypothetical protein
MWASKRMQHHQNKAEALPHSDIKTLWQKIPSPLNMENDKIMTRKAINS